ncbi:MAG TPA: 1-phosphofructokinase family hexose kinase [Halanaerobiaceae bacterium]|nr:1-phosphofructokinase family hexose kinase [Halanaerobiaceae bacterium]HOA41148.1 1-phosphofructokinase family hexose kinase [Halanaerobiales bacterium]HPZ63349.1 1-phosphofructokinase family hexose kinase [Halanaerobiales bacterium]HQD03550.1 1-phosphofructokinase family hexose kinase [Halanaerobiales bacterium]
MIITVTLNPALDKIIYLDQLHPGRLNRSSQVAVRAGGKGINVARILKALGSEVLAMGLVGGYIGERLEEIIHQEGLPASLIATKYISRENIKLIEKNKRETEINQEGKVDQESFLVFKEKLREKLPGADLLILSGSLPHGLSLEAYQELIELANEYKVKTILDSSGLPFEYALESRPYLIKPNINELSELAGEKLSFVPDVQRVVRKLLQKGIKNIIVSLGKKGAYLANGEESYLIIAPDIRVADTTVGAGDSMVAGLALALERGYRFLEMGKYATALATLYVSGEKLTESNIEKMINRLEVMDGDFPYEKL